jgi:DNA-binding transcriptional ArsR family regulator
MGHVGINVSGYVTFDEGDFAVGGARDESTAGAILVGAAAAEVRRATGPVAWCALEHLAASPRRGDKDTVAASVRSLASGLRVSKNTANRALSVLRAAGLVEPVQTRSVTGRFEAGRYRLVVPPSVVERVEVGVGECVPGASPSSALSGPGRARAFGSPAPVDVQQLSLLPGI